MNEIYDRAMARLREHGVEFTIHEHDPAHTVADAQERLPFPVERFLKTVAFRIKNGGYLLAALRGEDRADYRQLASASGAKRADIVPLSPAEVIEAFGVEIGSVGPLVMSDTTQVLFDGQVPAGETIFCGMGRPDRTLEINLADLVRLTKGRIEALTRSRIGT